MAASNNGTSPAALPPPTAPLLSVTFEELDNSVRNGKKKLYWSAFEVVLVTAQPGGTAPPLETRYDAYQVNHNHLKKLHAGARGPHNVRVECKYCTAPRFTQSITVSTKKFEEHYMTLHALDALASADAKKAQQLQQQQRKHGKTDGHEEEEEDEDMEKSEETAEDVARQQRPKRGARTAGDGGSGSVVKRARRGAAARDDDDHVAAMQGAAAAVVALSGGTNAARGASETTAPQANATQTSLPSSLVDSSVLLDPADSDTKRGKKSYWTAYEVVICERVPPSEDVGDGLEGGGGGETVVRETRQDAWRVNHNALRRLHLDPAHDTTVRVECRFCDEPKFNQSITVSTRKFEQHYYYEHGDDSQRQDLEERLAAKAAEAAAHAQQQQQQLGDMERPVSSLEAIASIQPKRRKSWKALTLERENSTGSVTKPPYATGHTNGNWRSGTTARHQRAQLLNWLMHETLPLSAVAGSNHFQAFVSSLDRKFEMPQPQALRAHLEQRVDVARTGVKKRIQDELASEAGTAFALTIDTFPVHTASDQATSFVSVTAHYISRDWERQQLLLACRAVPEAASHEIVWTIVRDVLGKFGIPTDAVVSATVRHADAMDVASFALASVAKPQGREPPAVIVLCAAGVLQAVAEAGVDVVRRSTTERLETLAQKERLSGAHSWVEFYTVLSTIDEPSVSLETLATAKEVVALLEPFVRVAQELSTTTAYPTIPMVFQYFRHLKETLAELKHSSKVGLTAAIKAMQSSLEDVFDKVVCTNALVAYVLDPRFRFAHISSVDEKRIRARIAAEIAAITGDKAVGTRNDGHADLGDASSGSAGAAGRPTRSLFEELATSGKRTSIGNGSTPTSAPKPAAAVSTTVSASAEFNDYLALDDEDFGVNVLQWWQTHEAKFPTLARVARQFLALVGTSLPADELFTAAGQQRVLRRSVLDVETLEATMLARAHPEPLVEQSPPQVQPARARIGSPAADAKRPKSNDSPPTAAMTSAELPPSTSDAAVVDTSDKESFAIVV